MIRRCAICGETSTQPDSGASTDIAPRDLDTRPDASPQDWLEQCPACGYAAQSIAEVADDSVPVLVHGAEYQALRNAPGIPGAARRFACHALLLDRLGFFADAGWTALHGAWACDDAGDESAARRLRARTIELWKKAKANAQEFMQDEAQEFALATDVLRRAGELAEARHTALEGLEIYSLAPLLEDIMRFELALIHRGDTAAHALAELPQRREGGQRVTLQ
jgi:hypothetical protein